jgi:hypothetical protein
MATTPSPDTGPDAANVAAIGAGILGVVLTVAALALYGQRTGLSVAAGATIAVLNLLTMRAIVRALVRSGDAEADANAEVTADAEAKADTTPQAEAETRDHRAEGRRGGVAWGAFALVKIFVLFGGIWILLTRGMVDPIGLVVGYGVLPLGIAASSLFTSLAPRPRRKTR